MNLVVKICHVEILFLMPRVHFVIQLLHFFFQLACLLLDIVLELGHQDSFKVLKPLILLFHDVICFFDVDFQLVSVFAGIVHDIRTIDCWISRLQLISSQLFNCQFLYIGHLFFLLFLLVVWLELRGFWNRVRVESALRVLGLNSAKTLVGRLHLTLGSTL